MLEESIRIQSDKDRVTIRREKRNREGECAEKRPFMIMARYYLPARREALGETKYINILTS